MAFKGIWENLDHLPRLGYIAGNASKLTGLKRADAVIVANAVDAVWVSSIFKTDL